MLPIQLVEETLVRVDVVPVLPMVENTFEDLFVGTLIKERNELLTDEAEELGGTKIGKTSRAA
jgi:hypothetical protein